MRGLRIPDVPRKLTRPHPPGWQSQPARGRGGSPALGYLAPPPAPRAIDRPGEVDRALGSYRASVIRKAKYRLVQRYPLRRVLSRPAAVLHDK